MDFKYEKLNFDRYNNRLNNITNNSRLTELGIRKELIGKTTYGYDLYDYVIGNGKKDLFIVGGMHGSEIISVDFVTQLLEHVPELTNYDPNLITLHIIPNINPEGFDITTSTLVNINDDKFKDESFDYYLRYRIDNIVSSYLNVLDNGFKNINNIISPKIFLNVIKKSFKEKEWSSLCDKRAVPKMVLFEKYVMSIDENKDFLGIIYDIKTGIDKLILNSKEDIYFCSALKRIDDSIFDYVLWDNFFNINKNTGSRLYQEKFKDIRITGTKNNLLADDVKKVLNNLGIPRGAQVKFDATGKFINLNQNTINNPGIKIMQNSEIIYGFSPSNNVINYYDGPIGKPTFDPYNFTYCIENTAINRLIDISYSCNRLVGVLLYHGTGGLVYYKVQEDKNLCEYNDILTESYIDKTGYKKVEREEYTGYGDYLRQRYPGVLLIELSKMGGNPIAPYGDISNIERVIMDNIYGFDNLVGKINELINTDKIVKNKKVKKLTK